MILLVNRTLFLILSRRVFIHGYKTVNKMYRWQRRCLGLAIVSTSLISLWLVMAPPATGYEHSIYAQYHSGFWLILCTALITATFSLYLSARLGRYKWRSVLMVLINYILFITIPEFRDYALFGRISDLLQHIAWAEQLSATGELTLYPGFQILLSILKLFDIPYEYHRALFGILFLGLWIVGLGLYARRTTRSQHTGVYALVAAVPLILGSYHISFQPAVKSFLLFPLVLLALDRYATTHHRRYLSIIILFGAAFMIMHPLTTFLFAVALVVFEVTRYSLKSRSKSDQLAVPVFIGLGALIGMVLWVLSVGRGGVVISQALVSLFVGSEYTEEASADTGGGIAFIIVDYLSETSLTTGQLVLRFVQLFGVSVLFLTLSGLIVLWGTWRWASTSSEGITEVHLGAQFITGIIIAVVFLLFPLIVSAPVRVSRYAILFGTIVISVALARRHPISTTPFHQHAPALCVVILLLLLVPAGVLTAYPQNQHLTHAEDQGIEFVVSTHDPSITVTGYQMDQRQAAYAQEASGEIDWVFNRHTPTDTNSFPKHLGYPQQTLGVSFGETYLITKEADIEYHEYYFENQRDELTYYTEEDIERIHTDQTANRVYSNGGFDVWRVYEPDT